MEHHSQCLYNGNSFPIQNMGTHALYKIWQLMPYTKYGNSHQNYTSWIIYIGGSPNPPSHPWSYQVHLQNLSSSSSI